MNDLPHVHNVIVRDRGSYWSIDYGDQYSIPDKPYIRKWRTEKKLRLEIAKLIRKHDRASLKARSNDRIISNAIPRLKTNEWGSKQIGHHGLRDHIQSLLRVLA